MFEIGVVQDTGMFEIFERVWKQTPFNIFYLPYKQCSIYQLEVHNQLQEELQDFCTVAFEFLPWNGDSLWRKKNWKLWISNWEFLFYLPNHIKEIINWRGTFSLFFSFIDAIFIKISFSESKRAKYLEKYLERNSNRKNIKNYS